MSPLMPASKLKGSLLNNQEFMESVRPFFVRGSSVFSVSPLLCFAANLTRWCSIILYFHPCLGKIPILTNIFQMGWNHHLAQESNEPYRGQSEDRRNFAVACHGFCVGENCTKSRTFWIMTSQPTPNVTHEKQSLNKGLLAIVVPLLRPY